jgi:hypothetical protein
MVNNCGNMEWTMVRKIKGQHELGSDERVLKKPHGFFR